MGGKGSGRIPRPAKLKLVEGVSEGRDSGGRRVPLPPSFVREAPEAPDWLPESAVEMWEHTTSELEALDLLKAADLGVLTAYCVSWDQLKRAVPLYARTGMLITNKQSGAIKANPALAIARAAIRDLLACGRELGCTPSAEQHVAALVRELDDESNPFSSGPPWRRYGDD